MQNAARNCVDLAFHRAQLKGFLAAQPAGLIEQEIEMDDACLQAQRDADEIAQTRRQGGSTSVRDTASCSDNRILRFSVAASARLSSPSLTAR